MKLKKFLGKWRINKFYSDKSNSELYEIFKELKVIIQDEEKAVNLLNVIKQMYVEIYCISMFNNLILKDVFNVYKHLLCLGLDVETSIKKGNEFFENYKNGTIGFDDLYDKFLSDEIKNIKMESVKNSEYKGTPLLCDMIKYLDAYENKIKEIRILKTQYSGPYIFERTPYLREIVDGLCEISKIKEVVFYKTTSVGPTLPIDDNYKVIYND